MHTHTHSCMHAHTHTHTHTHTSRNTHWDGSSMPNHLANVSFLTYAEIHEFAWGTCSSLYIALYCAPSTALAPPSPLPLPLPQLRVNSAPTYFHFPASGKRQPEDTYSASRHGIGAEALSKWVADRTEVHVSGLSLYWSRCVLAAKSLCICVSQWVWTTSPPSLV